MFSLLPKFSFTENKPQLRGQPVYMLSFPHSKTDLCKDVGDCIYRVSGFQNTQHNHCHNYIIYPFTDSLLKGRNAWGKALTSVVLYLQSRQGHLCRVLKQVNLLRAVVLLKTQQQQSKTRTISEHTRIKCTHPIWSCSCEVESIFQSCSKVLPGITVKKTNSTPENPQKVQFTSHNRKETVSSYPKGNNFSSFNFSYPLQHEQAFNRNI